MSEFWATEYFEQQQKAAGHVGLGELWHAVSQLGASRRTDQAARQFGMLGPGKQQPARPGAPIIQARPSAAAATGGGISPGKSIVPQTAPVASAPRGASTNLQQMAAAAAARRGGIAPK